ncbi:MAG: S41 family peptidase, partial [Bacteroidales bacterium]|nr:S41 family peptidase [Bacteroidales bacterium]
HTFIYDSPETVSVPCSFQWFNHSCYITRTFVQDSSYLGKEVLAIEKIPIDTLLFRVSILKGCENLVQRERYLMQLLNRGDMTKLKQIGINLEKEFLHISTADGEITLRNQQEGNIISVVKYTHPITGRSNESIKTYYNSDIAYLQLNSMSIEMEATQQRFDTFFSHIITQKVKTLVVDLRYNGGGNSLIGDMLLNRIAHPKLTQSPRMEYRKSRLQRFIYSQISMISKKEYKKFVDYHGERFDGTVYFIQGSNSFSSTALLLSKVIDNELFITIGEPASQKPCHYGEILSFELPNTKIKGDVSCKYFIRPAYKKCDEEYLFPDIYIPQAIEDYIDGKDPCWDWVIDKIRNNN